SLSSGATATIGWKQARGISTTGIQMYDGSGLSRSNRFSARHILDLTRYMLDSYPTWGTTLAISGVSGTISGRLSDLSGDVHAKTGSLGISIALSGFIENPHDGEQYL